MVDRNLKMATNMLTGVPPVISDSSNNTCACLHCVALVRRLLLKRFADAFEAES